MSVFKAPRGRSAPEGSSPEWRLGWAHGTRQGVLDAFASRHWGRGCDLRFPPLDGERGTRTRRRRRPLLRHRRRSDRHARGRGAPRPSSPDFRNAQAVYGYGDIVVDFEKGRVGTIYSTGSNRFCTPGGTCVGQSGAQARLRREGVRTTLLVKLTGGPFLHACRKAAGRAVSSWPTSSFGGEIASARS